MDIPFKKNEHSKEEIIFTIQLGPTNNNHVINNNNDDDNINNNNKNTYHYIMR